jgi:hypothetical protein
MAFLRAFESSNKYTSNSGRCLFTSVPTILNPCSRKYIAIFLLNTFLISIYQPLYLLVICHICSGIFRLGEALVFHGDTSNRSIENVFTITGDCIKASIESQWFYQNILKIFFMYCLWIFTGDSVAQAWRRNMKRT